MIQSAAAMCWQGPEMLIVRFCVGLGRITKVCLRLFSSCNVAGSYSVCMCLLYFCHCLSCVLQTTVPNYLTVLYFPTCWQSADLPGHKEKPVVQFILRWHP